MDECQHPAVTWDPYPLQYTNRMQTVHWFNCDDCPVRACVVVTDVVLND